MRTPTLLIHHGAYQPLWQQPGLIQVGPQIAMGQSFAAHRAVGGCLCNALQRGWAQGVYHTPIHFCCAAPCGASANADPPLACGDLHQASRNPAALRPEPHAVLLTFNPPWGRASLPMPVRCLAPTFFRYPSATPSSTALELLHVGDSPSPPPRELGALLGDSRCRSVRHDPERGRSGPALTLSMCP